MTITGNIENNFNMSKMTSTLGKFQNAKREYSSFSVDKTKESGVINEGKERERKRLKEVSEDFEALMINQMLKEMRKTVNKSGLIDGGIAEDIFEDMLYDEYSKEFSKSGTFGIADIIYKQMERYI